MRHLACTIFLFAFCINAFCGNTVKVKIKDHTVTAAIASTLAEQAQGFMFKPAIADHEAMLFVYQEDGIYSFWMKNTKFALDIIWLDAAKKAVHTKENFLPCVKEPCFIETPPVKARYVLEVKGGTVKKLNIKLGDSLQFELP